MSSHVEMEWAPPDEFVELTKDALDHLYDFGKLTNHRLARWLLPDPLPRGVSRAQALRQRLIDAIEQLDLGPRGSTHARQNRSFHLLELRYVEAMSFTEVMQTLALSQTQYHREQRRAIDMVAAYLWETRPAASSSDPQSIGPKGESSSANTPLGTELPQTEPVIFHSEDEVHLAPFLAEVVHLMDRMARGLSVRLRLASIDDRPVVIDRTALRSAIIGSTGFLLEQMRQGEIIITANRWAATVRIDLIAHGLVTFAEDDHALDEKLRWSRELIQALGGTLRLERTADGELTVGLGLPTQRATLLVVDDNPDLVQLIRRYLIDQEYLVISAASVEEGIAAVERIQPDVILLDVMMRHRDGWDALQVLRHLPATEAVPIVICTVLPEHQLARALGATAFIQKPLTRPALLQALARVRPDQPPLAARDPAGPEPRARSESWSRPDH